MPNSKIKELESVVAKLESERQGHLEAIAEIEAAFEKMGINSTGAVTPRKKPGPKPGKKRGGKPGPKPGLKRGPKPGLKRGPKPKAQKGRGPTGNRYAVSGTDLVLQMVKGAGAKGIPGGEVNAVWKQQGRAGTAYNILGQLAKDHQIKKQKNKEGRGSMYVAS